MPVCISCGKPTEGESFMEMDGESLYECPKCQNQTLREVIRDKERRHQHELQEINKHMYKVIDTVVFISLVIIFIIFCAKG